MFIRLFIVLSNDAYRQQHNITKPTEKIIHTFTHTFVHICTRRTLFNHNNIMLALDICTCIGWLMNDYVALSDGNWIIVYFIIMRYLLCFVVIIFTQPKCARPPADKLLARLKCCRLWGTLVNTDWQAFRRRRNTDCCGYRVYLVIGCKLGAVQIILFSLTYVHDIHERFWNDFWITVNHLYFYYNRKYIQNSCTVSTQLVSVEILVYA